MKINNNGEGSLRTDQEMKAVDELLNIHMSLVPRLGAGWNQHSLVTLRRQSMSRILYLDWIYNKLIGKPGVICEFGVQWGGVLSILANLRGMYEPFNHQRKIYGFDTGEGLSKPEGHKDYPSAFEEGDYPSDMQRLKK